MANQYSHRDDADTAPDSGPSANPMLSGMRPIAEPGQRVSSARDWIAGAVLLVLIAVGLALSNLDLPSSVRLWSMLGIAAIQALVLLAAYMDRDRPREVPLILMAVAGALALVFLISSVMDREEYEPDVARFERPR